MLAGQLAEVPHRGGEVVMLGIDDRVGAVGGDDAAPPARGADRGMMVQILVRALGRCEQFDVEAVEPRARSHGGAGEAFVDSISTQIGRASCREKGCLYGEITVRPVYYKKN